MMKSLSAMYHKFLLVFGILGMLVSGQAIANGPVGEHVNHLQDNLGEYEREVQWLIDKVDGIVATYEKKGAKAAKSGAVVDHWEAVKFHSAIETNYVPVYASIWQGLFGVKESIDKQQSIAEVRKQQRALEQALWQALGAVKLAAQYQQRGLLAKVKTTDSEPKTASETLEAIKQRLDRVVAKYAEKLPAEATSIVHDTYLNLFEGLEGDLIEQNAQLVEDLEKYFNVTLPQSLDSKAAVADVRAVVDSMKTELNKAKALLEKAEKNRKEVF